MQSQLLSEQIKKEANNILKKHKYLIWQCYIINFIVNVYLISFSPHFIVHISSHFLQSTLHWPCFIFISFSLPQSISFICNLFGCIHITWSLNLMVSFTFQLILSLEIKNLQVTLHKFLILDRYSLLEAESSGFTTPCLFILNKK